MHRHKFLPYSMQKLYTDARPIAERVEKRDLKSLQQLRHALTEKRSISHYAGWSDADVQEMLRDVDAALGLLEPKQRKPRTKTTPSKGPLLPLPVALDVAHHADLFADSSRWPRRPYCTNNPASGLRIRPLHQAVGMSHIQHNRPGLCTWLAFDIDRADAENAWRSAGLLEPTWTAVNSENGHCHLAYGLRMPVLVSGLGARDAPLRYLASLQAMMGEKLGADLRYTGLITKNPASAEWRTLRGPCMAYDLAALAAVLHGIQQ